MAEIPILSQLQLDTLEFPIYKVHIGSKSPYSPQLIIVGGVHGIERIGSRVVIALLETWLQRMTREKMYAPRFNGNGNLFYPHRQLNWDVQKYQSKWLWGRLDAQFKVPKVDKGPLVNVIDSENDRLFLASCSIKLARHFDAPINPLPWAGHDLPQDDRSGWLKCSKN